MKKILLISLVLCLLFSLLTTTVLADYSASTLSNIIIIGEDGSMISPGKKDTSYFDITKDGVISLKRDITIPTSLEIPAEVGGIKAKTIAGNFFGPITCIDSLRIAEGIETIGRKAFRAEKTLREIFLPSTLISIEDEAFYNCANLSSISFPKSVAHIGASAFLGCRSLKTVELPEGLTSIGGSCFHGCTKLKSIYIPASVKSIGKNAFYECDNLNTVNFAGTAEQWRAMGSEAYLPKGCCVVCECNGSDSPGFDKRTTRKVTRVEASSTLDQGWIKHGATNLIDGNLDTAWSEGVKGDGINENVTFYFGKQVTISGIIINNGYQKRQELYDANNRPAELFMELSDGSSATLYLDDVCNAQSFDFNVSVKTEWVRLTISDVYYGDCEDTVITEIRFVG